MVDLPSDWEIKRVADLGEVITGRTPSTSRPEFYGGEYKLISPADLDSGKYVLTCHKNLSHDGFQQCRVLPKDTVLVGCIENVGKLGMIGDDYSATNQQINSIIPNSDYNSHFLYYALQFCRPRLEQAAAKVTVPILNKSNFENFQIAAPEKTKQDILARFFRHRPFIRKQVFQSIRPERSSKHCGKTLFSKSCSRPREGDQRFWRFGSF